MDTKSHIKGSLLGYQKLPLESGIWGIILPRVNERVTAHAPSANDLLQEVSLEHLLFSSNDRLGNRGFLFSTFLCVAVFTAPMFFWALSFFFSRPLWFALPMLGVALLFFGSSVATAYLSARRPLPPPTIFCRSLRKVYSWHAKTRSWVALPYDELVPVAFRNKIVTTSGSATVYVLTLCKLESGTREIEYAISPAPPRGHPQFCGEIWEFIRRYMDGSPEDLPPVRLLPADSHPNSWMARKDRAEFTDFVDDEHRVKPHIFAYCVVYFWGSMGYWWDRAAGWIARTAPRVALPSEVLALPKSDHNPYKIAALTESELLASVGTLPQLRRRWLICGIVGTLIWGVMFGLPIAGVVARIYIS